jgi:hypothetical protein
MTDQELIGEQEYIQRTLVDYAWACDNGDWGLLRSLFTADAYLDYSSTAGPAGGREEVVNWLQESLTQLDFIQHVVSNFQLDVTGDKASGRAMFFTTFRLPGVPEVLFTGGYYQLELVRDTDRWMLKQLIEDNRWMSGSVGAAQG